MGWGPNNFPSFFCHQGGCTRSQRCSRCPLRSPHELRLTGSQSVGSDAVSTLPDHLQRWQHASAGQELGLMTPIATGTAHACWLGPRSNGPPETWLELEPIQHCCHVQLAAVRKYSPGNALMPCFCFARQDHVLSWNLGATSLLVAVPRLGGLGHQNLSRLLLPSGRLGLQPAVLKASCRSPHELRLTGSQSVGSDPVSTLPDHLQRGQHASAG